MSPVLPPVLPLCDADRDGIGGKARRLSKLAALRPTLFAIPDGVVVTPSFSAPSGADDLARAVAALGAATHAVRSSALDEDESHSSAAGRYRTELHVAPDRILAAVEAVRASFRDRAAGSVLIQPMLAPRLAGVVFSRSPENPGLSLCEYASGTADRLVAGETAPCRAEFGRWSGVLHGVPPGADAKVLERVFLAATLIEEALGGPQDVEWAWVEEGLRLHVLQSRDVTASTFSPAVAAEQARAARLVLSLAGGPRGKVVLRGAAAREVVREPTRLTRSLLERLYSPGGALGIALRRLGLPCPPSKLPHLASAFGRLHAIADTERRLFGPSLRRFLAVRALRKRMTLDREGLLASLEAGVASMPDVPAAEGSLLVAPGAAARAAAERLALSARWFGAEVYPHAFAATLAAQVAAEPAGSGAAAGRLFSDLSRLHHAGDVDGFLARWGHRSANDYELSEPRFAEAPARARELAARFAEVPWASDGEEQRTFTWLKEHAKDEAIRRLGAVRADALRLAETLDIPPEAVFALSLDDVEALAAGKTDAAAAADLASRQQADEAAIAAIDLGEDVSLEHVERLGRGAQAGGGLCGRMVGAKRGFSGVVRDADARSAPGAGEPTVLLAAFLRPELVAKFPASAGCVAEVGGMLSHAAIVAREMGFPVLVLPGSTTTLQGGDRVDVDAGGAIRVTRPARAS